MTPDTLAPVQTATLTLDVSEATPRRPWWIVPLLVLLVSGTAVVAWQLGFRPDQYFVTAPTVIPTVAVDEGEFVVLVTENGTLESAKSEVVKCQVEALVGTVGGMQGGRPGGGGRSGGQAAGQAGGAPAPARGGAAGGGAAGGARALGARTGGAAARGGAAGAAGARAAAPAAGGDGSTGTTVMSRPNIRSFTYQVPPHVPLRPAMMGGGSTLPQGGMMMGGGDGGRGGRGGGNPFGDEKAGSTRIIKILPEGTKVKAGEIVCELDSAAFRDELAAQEIKYSQAKAWVEQAKSVREVNEITLREYRDGIYPQDLSLIRQYVRTCRVEEERSRRNLEWSKQTYKQGFRASAQVKGDEQDYERTMILLREAEGMERRLTEFTMPRLVKTLEAKVEASLADMLAQASSFQLESDRLRRLKKVVANCVLHAPSDGTVVYVNQTNSWGRTEAQIQEGVTVREGQPIFQLPDPRYMRVKAKINESKVAYVRTGQQVEVVIDAFHDRSFRGKVAEITPIPSPANGPFSDTKIYFAMIDVDVDGFDGLRPGLSAEVKFLVSSDKNTTRVPIQSVRWVEDQPFAAVASPGGTTWTWTPIKLGLFNEEYGEVVSGLKPGDRVVARPDALPRPEKVVEPTETPAVAVRFSGQPSL